MPSPNLPEPTGRHAGRRHKDHPSMTLALAVLLTLALLLGQSTSSEAAGSVQMVAKAGYEGAGKVGGWLPVLIDIRNDGDEIDGEIQIVVQDTATNRGTYTPAPTVFSVPAVLPRRSRKQLHLEVRLPTSGQRIRAKLIQGDELLLEQDVQFQRVPAGDLLCGVLSRTSSALEFLPTLELPPPLRRVRLARMELSDVPVRAQLLSSLDCLIVDNMPTAGLSENQADALRTWVANGGLLIAAGGPGWQKSFTGLPADLLPVRVTGTTTVSNLTNLADFGREPFPDGGQYLASQAVVTDGNAVVEQAGTPLVVAARRGLGTVFYLALDPAIDPLRGWAGSGGLWRYMLAHSGTNTAVAASTSTPFTGWGRVPRNALIDISSLRPPSPNTIIGALVLFTALVGPVNYLLLRRLGQPTWALVTVPLFTGVASLLIFGAATAERDSDSIMTKMTLVRAMPSAPVAHARTYVGLLSKQQSTYDVRAADGSLVYGLFYPFPRDPSAEGSGWGLKVINGASPSISELSLPAGSLATFTVDGPFRSSGGIETDLMTDGRSVVGTITNRSAHQLSDAALVIDFSVEQVGDIRPGETKEIELALPPAATAGYGPPNAFANKLYPSGLPQKKPSDAARRDLLDSAFGQAFNFSKLDFYGPTLLGWLETGGVDLDVRPSRPSAVENTLYVGSVPVKLPKGYEGDIPAAVVSHRPLGAMTASRQQFNTYDLAPGESVALQFSLPVHTGRFLLERLNLNVEAAMRGPGSAGAPLGEMQFFNWRSAEWEEHTFTYGTNAVSDPLAYISGTGDVRLRYTFRPAPDANVSNISFRRLDLNATGLMR
jgi:hypothetical protein